MLARYADLSSTIRTSLVAALAFGLTTLTGVASHAGPTPTPTITPFPDFCFIDKKCSVGGSEPQDSCTAQPGEEVTYTYDFIGGSALIIDDKLGEIGEFIGQTLSRATTLTETTTNTATFEPHEAVCLNGTFQDSVTVTVGTPTPTPAPFCGDGTVDPGEECEDNSDCPPHTPICIPGLCRCDPDLVTPPPTPTSLTPTPPTPTIPPTCAQLNPSVTINTIGKGQSPTNNAKVFHTIKGNIIDPGSLSDTAHRIPVCAGTSVMAKVSDSTGEPTNTANGSLSCNRNRCRGVVNVTEKYTSVSQDGRDRDRITFVPR